MTQPKEQEHSRSQSKHKKAVQLAHGVSADDVRRLVEKLKEGDSKK